VLAALPAGAAPKVKAEAVVAGTVFRPPGFALPEAELVLTVKTPPPGLKPGKTLRVRSDGRGEFAIRVPAGKAEYTLKAAKPGFEAQEKAVHVENDERTDTYFELKPVTH
jgi:hypothetical protein